MSKTAFEVHNGGQKRVNHSEQNYDAIKLRYPKMLTPIRKAADIQNATITKTNIHLPTLTVDGIHLYDTSNPIEAIRHEVQAWKPTGTMLAVFFGLGLGYDPLFYSEQIAKDAGTEYCLIVEPDMGMVKLACQHAPIWPLIQHPNIDLMVGMPCDSAAMFNELCRYFKANQRYHNLRAVKFFYTPKLYERNAEYYETFQREFVNAARFCILEYGNDPLDSLIGVENMFKNLNEIINFPGINLLKDSCKFIPGIVVSTGPSLDKNKHLLKGLENKAVIVAADASLRPLLNIGVKPHIVATLEREMAVVDLFAGVTPEDVKETYLAGCPVIYPEVYKAFPGNHIIVYRNFDHFKWLGIERGILDIKLSAGNMAFNICQHLGCDPIILIGQDLALDNEKTNADGAVLGTEQDSYLNEPRFMVQANAGGEIMTTRSLKSYLEAYIIDVAHHTGTVINATEGGAYIAGTQVMPFADAITNHIQSTTNIRRILADDLSAFEPGQDLPKVKQLISDTIDDVRKMQELCEQGVAYIDSIRDQVTPEAGMDKLSELLRETLAIKDKVIKTGTERGQAWYTWQGLVAHVMQAWFLSFEMEMRALREIGLEKSLAEVILRHGREYIDPPKPYNWFPAMGRGFQLLQKCLEDAKEDIQERERITC